MVSAKGKRVNYATADDVHDKKLSRDATIDDEDKEEEEDVAKPSASKQEEEKIPECTLAPEVQVRSFLRASIHVR